MPPRKRINQKLKGKGPLRERLSDTPKKSTPSKRTTNCAIKFAAITNTPESTTPKRRSALSLTPSVSSPDTDDFIDISEILKVNWKIFRVSPIYDFNKNKLKIYGRKLKEELAAANYRIENSVYDCKLQFRKLLLQETHNVIQFKCLSKYSQPLYNTIVWFLENAVLQEQTYSVAGGLTVTVAANNTKYIGYFISSVENQAKEEIPNIKHFPVLLVQANGKILKQVHNVFCKFFDCDIHPANFPFQALITFFTIMSHMYENDVPNLDSEVVTLHYKIPGCAQSDSITVSLSLDATSTVFAVFNQEFGQTLSSIQIISGFYDLIIKHVLNVYHVDVSLGELFKIIFPDFAVNSEGWVKFYSEDVVKRIIPGIEDFIKLENIGRL